MDSVPTGFACKTPGRCPATGATHRHVMAATTLCDASASRRELLEAALQQADDELSDACRCFRAWVGRQREVLDVLRALPADTACSSLVAQAEKLKTGTELEDLLCAISVFPSTLDRTLMELSSVISANSGQLQPAIVRDGREPVLVQRDKVTRDANSPQWESAWLKVEAGALMLFSSADSARPSTSVLLSGYFYEHAGGGERTNGQRDVRLHLSMPQRLPKQPAPLHLPWRCKHWMLQATIMHMAKKMPACLRQGIRRLCLWRQLLLPWLLPLMLRSWHPRIALQVKASG